MVRAWPLPKLTSKKTGNNFIYPISRPTLTKIERKNLSDAIKSTEISGSGLYVDLAEKVLKERIGNETLVVSNGSVALILALKTLGIGIGDEVLVPNLTYAATASSVIHVGANPIFCDVEKSTWNISIKSLEKMITRKTKAVIVVHLYGIPSNMDQIMSFAKYNKIKVIEDSAESFLSTYKGFVAGTIGDAGTFSFFANKIVTSGEGGAVTFKNKKDFNKAKLLRGQGMDPSRRYYFLEPGYNFRLNNLSASLLYSQLIRFDEIIEKRKRIFSAYDELLNSIITRQHANYDHVASPWLYSVTLPKIKKDTIFKLASYLADEGIETRPIFPPLNTMPAYKEFRSDLNKNSEKIFQSGISIPTFFDLKFKDLKFIAEKFKMGVEVAKN